MWEMISSCCYTGAMPCNAQLLLEHTGATTCVEALGQKLHRAPSLFALVLGLFLGFGFCRMTCCWRSLAAYPSLTLRRCQVNQVCSKKNCRKQNNRQQSYRRLRCRMEQAGKGDKFGLRWNRLKHKRGWRKSCCVGNLYAKAGRSTSSQDVGPNKCRVFRASCCY